MAKFGKKWRNALFELPVTNFLDWKKDFWYWFSHYIPPYVCIYLKTAQSHSERKILFRFQKTILIFLLIFFWKYARKKIHLLSAFLEWFSIFNYSPLLPISELVLDKKFHQNAALCIHLWKRIKSHEMKIRKSNRALTGKNFSSSLNPEILRKG